jgi:hypothetical protein
VRSAISNDEHTGTVRLQPCYFEDRELWLEASNCEWVRNKPDDCKRWLNCRWWSVNRTALEIHREKVIWMIREDMRQMAEQQGEAAVCANEQRKMRTRLKTLYDTNAEWREQATRRLEKFEKQLRKEVLAKIEVRGKRNTSWAQ